MLFGDRLSLVQKIKNDIDNNIPLTYTLDEIEQVHLCLPVKYLAEVLLSYKFDNSMIRDILFSVDNDDSSLSYYLVHNEKFTNDTAIHAIIDVCLYHEDYICSTALSEIEFRLTITKCAVEYANFPWEYMFNSLSDELINLLFKDLKFVNSAFSHYDIDDKQWYELFKNNTCLSYKILEAHISYFNSNNQYNIVAILNKAINYKKMVVEDNDIIGGN